MVERVYHSAKEAAARAERLELSVSHWRMIYVEWNV